MINRSSRNTRTSKPNKYLVKNKPKLKPKLNRTIRKKNKPENKNKPVKNKGEGLDEKGNPFPMKDPHGGLIPICPPGYKIDNDFDPFNDPINPLYRCIPDLKEPEDELANSLMNEVSETSNNTVSIKNGVSSSGGGKMTRSRMLTRRRPRNQRKK